VTLYLLVVSGFGIALVVAFEYSIHESRIKYPDAYNSNMAGLGAAIIHLVDIVISIFSAISLIGAIALFKGRKRGAFLAGFTLFILTRQSSYSPLP
jgi:hypothetical protein